MVRVIQVDAVGLQSLERGVRLAFDRLRPQVAEPGIAPAADLGGQHDLVAVSPVVHPAPEYRLRPAMFDQVGVRGVDEVAAGFGVRVEDGTRLRLIGGPAEHVAAETDGEDVETCTAEGDHAANLSGPADRGAASKPEQSLTSKG